MTLQSTRRGLCNSHYKLTYKDIVRFVVRESQTSYGLQSSDGGEIIDRYDSLRELKSDFMMLVDRKIILN